MRFPPKTEEELSTLLPGGDYFFEVADATDDRSKAGNDMVKLQLTVYDENERRHTIFDYLVASDGAAYKIRNFAVATGLLPIYETGEIPATRMIGCTGKCKVGIDDKNKAYAPKNIIRDYLANGSATSGHTTTSPVAKGAAPTVDMDDDIPFAPEWR